MISIGNFPSYLSDRDPREHPMSRLVGLPRNLQVNFFNGRHPWRIELTSQKSQIELPKNQRP